MKFIYFIFGLLMTSAVANADVCNGTFRINANGFPGSLEIQTMEQSTRSREMFEGRVRFDNGQTDRVRGSCLLARDGDSGTIRFVRYMPNNQQQDYQGQLVIRDGEIRMQGRFEQNNQQYNWSAVAPEARGDEDMITAEELCSGTFAVRSSDGSRATLVLRLRSRGDLRGTVAIPGRGSFGVRGTCNLRRNDERALVTLRGTNFLTRSYVFSGNSELDRRGRVVMTGSYNDGRKSLRFTAIKRN